MNERIKELSKEAFEYALSQRPGSDEFQPIWAEKFAELIVKECAKAADEGLAQVTMKVEWPSYHIKKHFGVEE